MKQKLFLTYLAATLFLILYPLNDIVKLDKLIFELRPDLLAHGVLLFPWMFLKPTQKPSNCAWAAIGVLYGMGLEFSHYFLPYRSFDINDMIANGVGVGLSCVGLYFWNKIISIRGI